MINKKYIVKFVFILLTSGIFFGCWYFFWPHKIYIDNKYDNTVTIGVQLDHDGYEISPVFKSEKDGGARIRRGHYLVKHEKPGYRPSFSSVSIPKNNRLVSPQLLPTIQTENKILKKERPNIHAVIEKSIPENYTVSSEKIFNNGWYGASIKSSDPTEDSLKIILHKSDNEWRVMVRPTIIIYNKQHPKIPKIIISIVNNTLS